MCWVSAKKPVMLIADKDIPVKKILSVQDGKLCSPVQHAEWKLNVVYKTALQSIPEHINNWYLNYGFHSCSAIYTDPVFWRNALGVMIFKHEEYDSVYDAIIPKGSKYYVNESGDYISNQLMICVG